MYQKDTYEMYVKQSLTVKIQNDSIKNLNLALALQILNYKTSKLIYFLACGQNQITEEFIFKGIGLKEDEILK